VSGLTVAPYDGESAAWDALVRASAGWSHFHLWGWKPVIERTHRHPCVYLAAHQGGALAGVLPLVRVRSRLFGHYLVSMPFLNYGGPLGSADAVRALTAEAVAMAGRDGVKLLELRSREPLPVDLPVSHRKITVILDLLPGDPDGVFARFPAKLRSQVRRPAKEGVTVKFGRDQVTPFFAVFARHMRDLGTPTQPRSLFEAIADQFGDEAWFGCAYLGEVPIACGAGFRMGGEFEMTWASALVAYNKLSPNMALYWAFIERAAREGLALFNFGRCTPGSGTHRFKQQWGGRDVPLHWYQRAAGGGGAEAHTPSPDDGAYRWGPKLWARLPVGVATALGPHIVRGIP
jgi:FemAB-related protein (PEP-CTERM system-associated)